MDVRKYFPHHLYVARPWRAPIRAIKDEWYNIKAFLRRGRMGWAYIDLWNMDNYLGVILPAMLRHLGENHCGMPMEYVEKYKDDDEASAHWKADLLWVADLIEYANSDADDHNPYAEEYWEACGLGRKTTKKVDGTIVSTHNTEVDEELKKKYYDYHMEIGKRQQEAIKKAFAWLGEHYFELWD